MRWLVLVILFCGQFGYGQTGSEDLHKLQAYEDTLRQLTDSMIMSKDADTRIRAGSAYLIPMLVNALKVSNSYEYPFDSLDRILILNAPDNSFRVFTWHVEMYKGLYRQFGAIQMNSKELQLFPLIDKSDMLRVANDTALTDGDWFGAVYYNIIVKKTEGQKYYILFGMDANTAFSKKKVMDILYFPDGKPVMGAPIIDAAYVMGKDTMPRVDKRYIIEYSEKANATFNYFDKLGMVIFDHLGPKDDNNMGIPAAYLPDGTYEGFEWKNGRLVYIPKVFHQMLDEVTGPPVPRPVDFDKETPHREDIE